MTTASSTLCELLPMSIAMCPLRYYRWTLQQVRRLPEKEWVYYAGYSRTNFTGHKDEVDPERIEQVAAHGLVAADFGPPSAGPHRLARPPRPVRATSVLLGGGHSRISSVLPVSLTRKTLRVCAVLKKYDLQLCMDSLPVGVSTALLSSEPR